MEPTKWREYVPSVIKKSKCIQANQTTGMQLTTIQPRESKSEIRGIVKQNWYVNQDTKLHHNDNTWQAAIVLVVCSDGSSLWIWKVGGWWEFCCCSLLRRYCLPSSHPLNSIYVEATAKGIQFALTACGRKQENYANICHTLHSCQLWFALLFEWLFCCLWQLPKIKLLTYCQGKSSLYVFPSKIIFMTCCSYWSSNTTLNLPKILSSGANIG